MTCQTPDDSAEQNKYTKGRATPHFTVGGLPESLCRLARLPPNLGNSGAVLAAPTVEWVTRPDESRIPGGQDEIEGE